VINLLQIYFGLKLKIKEFLISLDFSTYIRGIYFTLGSLSFLQFTGIQIFDIFKYQRVKEFNGMIGQALVYNLDVNSVIFQFYLFYLVILPLLFILSLFVLKESSDAKFLSYDIEKERLNLLQIVSSIGILSFFVEIYNFLTIDKYPNKFSISFYIYIFWLLLVFYPVLKKKVFKNLSLNSLKWAFFCSFLILNILISVYHREFIFDNFSYIFVFLVLFFCYLLNSLKETNQLMLKAFLIPASLYFIIFSVFVELSYVLVQYEVYIWNFKYIKYTPFFITLLLLLIFFTLNYKKEKIIEWEKFIYPLMLLGISLISIQPKYTNEVNLDIFEGANHGISIYEYFNYSMVPIVENFGAHALYNTFWGILYGIINNDSKDAIFAIYSVYRLPLEIIIFYFILSRFVSRDFTFFFCIVFPFNFNFFNMLDLASFVVIIFILVLKRPSLKNYILFWTITFILILHKIDTGLAFGLSSSILLFLFSLINFHKLSLKKFLLSFLVVSTFFLLIYLYLAKINDIDPIERLEEIKYILNSQVSWAYSGYYTLYDKRVVFIYFLIPAITLFISLILLNKSLQQKNFNKLCQISVILIFGFAVLLNMNRILTRHSLLETIVYTQFASFIFFYAIYFFKDSQKYLSVFLLPLFILLYSYPQNIKLESLSNIFLYKLDSKDIFEYIHKKVPRTNSSSLTQKYEEYKYVFDTLLDPDETFVDYTNSTLIYALTSYKKPFYVNQFPALINGETMQNRAISQIKNTKSTLLLLPLSKNTISNSIDGIPISLKYYLISEYLYMNYRPLFILDSQFYVWVKNDSYERIRNRLALLKDNSIFSVSDAHSMTLQSVNPDIYYNLGYLPYIMANLDKSKNKDIYSSENSVKIDEKITDNLFDLKNLSINKTMTWYIMIKNKSLINNVKEFSVQLLDEHKNILSNYQFTLNDFKEGTYILRISSDYIWYTDELRFLQFNKPKSSDEFNYYLIYEKNSWF